MKLHADQIRSMTREEKLLAMEDLWENLRQSPEDIHSPDWHAAELRETEARLERGEEKFLDWDAVRDSLGRRP